MEWVDTLVVDKTGTLTEGKPKVAAVIAIGEVKEGEVPRLAAKREHAFDLNGLLTEPFILVGLDQFQLPG